MKKVIVVNFILFTALFLLLAGVTLARKPIHFGDGWYTNLNGSGTEATFHSGSFCSTSGGSCTGPGTNTVVRWECGGEQTTCQQENENWGSSQSLGNPGCGNTVQLDVFDRYCRDGGLGTWSCGAPSDYMVWYSGDCAPPPPPPPPPTVTIGGKVTNTSGQGLSGVTISIYDNTLGQTQTVITDSSGNFSKSDFVRSTDAYAVRPPGTPPSGYQHPPSPSSYENQTAGGTPDCGTGCNFIYTPTEPTPLTVSCTGLPNPANSGQEVTWTAFPSGGTGTYTYIWSGDVSGTINPVRQTYTNTGTTSITKIATVQVTSGTENKSASCSVTINPAGTLTVNTSSACALSNTAQTISASWNNTGAASYQPDLKEGGVSVGGINCTTGTSFSFPGTYSLTKAYTAYVTAFSGANCVGIITTASKNVTNAVCTAASPSPSTTTSTSECTPPPEYGCTSAINIGCQTTTSAKNLWCQTNYGQAYCQYCPPPPNTSGTADANCSRGTEIMHLDGTTSCTNLGGQTVSCSDYTARYLLARWNVNPPQQEEEAASLPSFLQKALAAIFPHFKAFAQTQAAGAGYDEVKVYRSGKEGFLDLDKKQLGENPSQQGVFYSRSLSDGYTYYQAQSYNAKGTANSPTSAFWITSDQISRLECGWFAGLQHDYRISNIRVSSTTSTSTKLTWKLETRYSSNIPASYILYKNGQIGYIPSSRTTKTTIKSCFSGCSLGDTIYDVSYTLTNLTPQTNYSLNIGHLQTACNEDGNSIPGATGAVSVTTSAGTGAASPPSAPSAPKVASPTDTEVLPITFTPPTSLDEEGTRIFQTTFTDIRWDRDVQLNTYYDGQYFYGREDLSKLPAGTYYFGLYAEWSSSCKVFSPQLGFIWTPPVLPWIKTTGGDVHSNTGIHTPGGP